MTTKSDLIDSIASGAGITKVQSGKALESFIEAVQKSLAKGDNVTLVGFGTFKVTKRQAREGRNPKTGAVIKIPAKNAVSFSAGKTLKDSVNTSKKK